MKKLLLFVTALLSAGAIFAQTDCSELFISEYVEGWNNNKSMELYNPTSTAITLDNVYRLIRWSNGNSAANTDPLYVLPLTGTIQPYKVMVMIQDTTKPGQDTMVWPTLRKRGTWLAPYDYGGTTPGGNVVFWNGDDAVSLQKKIGSTWTDVDIFGEIGVRPKNWQGTYSPSGAWTDTKPYIMGNGVYLTKSHSLKRKHTILHGVNLATMITYGNTQTGGVPDSFDALLEYDTLAVNFFDSLGTHWCDCKKVTHPVLELGVDQSVNAGDTVTLDAGVFTTYTWSTGSHSRIVKIDSAGVGYGTKKVYCVVTDTYGTQSDTVRITFKRNQGIVEHNAGLSISIQPNPVTNKQFTVTGSQNISAVEVISIVGKTICSKPVNSSQKVVKVSLSDVSEGIYMVRVTFMNNQSVTKKIILQ